MESQERQDQYNTLLIKFNYATLEECEQQFEECCESRVEQFIASKDKLSILRSCIELLNRLEGTRHNLFAGRVLLFLAKVIPLFDQSGVNLRSEFGINKVPQLVIQRIKERKQDEDIEEGETLSDDDANSSEGSSDEDLFDRFWRLQQILEQPNSLYTKTTFLSFRAHVDGLVSYFEDKPANTRVWKTNGSYMTEPRAMSLQLDDINLRRTLLLQLLIGMQYIELPVDTRPDTMVLDKSQTSWLSMISRRIFELLASMQEGREFSGLVGQVLDTEELWNRWKNDKCRQPAPPETGEDEDDIINMGVTYHKRRKVSDELRSARPYNMHVIGSQEMSKLWNRKPIQRAGPPDLTRCFNIPVEKHMDTFKDPNKNFRLLRLLRKSPHFFTPTAATIQSLDNYLKSLADKHFSNNSSVA